MEKETIVTEQDGSLRAALEQEWKKVKYILGIMGLTSKVHIYPVGQEDLPLLHCCVYETCPKPIQDSIPFHMLFIRDLF